MTMRHVRIERRGRVAVVRFGREDGRNALSRTLIGELTAAARELDEDADLSAVVLAADGEHFTYGYDLREGVADPDAGLAERRTRQRMGPRLCAAWAALEPVTFCAIEGWCIGGGVALSAAFDFRVAGDAARFYVPEVERGMNMSWQSIPRLVSLVGASRTRRLTLLAQRIDAATALEWGLVDECAPAGGAFDAAMRMAERVAALPPVQVRMCKEDIALAERALHHAVSAIDRDQFLLAQSSDDYLEGVRSFLEKRPPAFKGR